MHDTEREQRVIHAMTRHRDRPRLADAIAAVINQHNAEEADALSALAIVMERITAVQIGISYAEWAAYYQPTALPAAASTYTAATVADLDD